MVDSRLYVNSLFVLEWCIIARIRLIIERDISSHT